MVEISSSGSGEGPEASPRGYSTSRSGLGLPRSVAVLVQDAGEPPGSGSRSGCVYRDPSSSCTQL